MCQLRDGLRECESEEEGKTATLLRLNEDREGG